MKIKFSYEDVYLSIDFIDEIDFDDSGLEVGQQISYSEYIKRLKNAK